MAEWSKASQPSSLLSSSVLPLQHEQGMWSREALSAPCRKEVTSYSNILNFLPWPWLRQYLSFRPCCTKQEEIASCLMSHLLVLRGRSYFLKTFLFGKAWKKMLMLFSFTAAAQAKCSSIPHQHTLTLLPSTSLLFIIKLMALFVSKCIAANSYSRI